jgi:hypothetical protein
MKKHFFQKKKPKKGHPRTGLDTRERSGGKCQKGANPMALGPGGAGQRDNKAIRLAFWLAFL